MIKLSSLGCGISAIALATITCTCNANADLVGTTVTGQLFTSIGAPPIGNLFDPALNGIDGGFVPAGFLNSSGPTVTISTSQVEFAFIRADFGAETLLLTDVQTTESIPMQTIFYDSGFEGLNFAVSSDTFPTGTFIEHGIPNQIRVGIPDFGIPGSYSAVYTLIPAPEPGGALLLTAVSSLLMRRRNSPPLRQ